ncbi:stage II sporulation protein AB (anti-sigma F factor) [Alkalibaculum bacchi]|uniref:Anti-sigma F factor n=1 Tax=Alkalibaculum bacchi TaxID=645887 RepID=A0A366IC73_9FIRM|nr:anti-sigma F factor [Alkalibaculum bacchi]RBP68366.1 stage II sporulation protein AB (anti-sigma F factor) [Alkalibaculum bacchi]
MMNNRMKLEILSKSDNESFARVVVSAFAAKLDPTIEEITDIKTAVSEAVTNSIIHGYNRDDEVIHITCEIDKNTVIIEVIDYGVGIKDVGKAMEPLFTSKPEMERSGMGFTVMESFMDEVEVKSIPGVETRVKMKKTINSAMNR